MLSRKTPPLVALTTWSKDTSSHLGNEDCMMRSTAVILSKWMLLLDGDHLGNEDCMMRSTAVILSKWMLLLDGDHLGNEDKDKL